MEKIAINKKVAAKLLEMHPAVNLQDILDWINDSISEGNTILCNSYLNPFGRSIVTTIEFEVTVLVRKNFLNKETDPKRFLIIDGLIVVDGKEIADYSFFYRKCFVDAGVREKFIKSIKGVF